MNVLCARRPIGRRLFVVLGSVALLVLAGFWGIGFQSGSAAGPRFVLVAPDEVAVGEPIEVALSIHDSNGISAFDATIGFDTAVASLQSYRPSDSDLTQLGMDVRALGPIEVPGGFAIGAYACPFDNCAEIDGKKPNREDGKGNIQLATFTLVAQDVGSLTIDLSTAQFTDTSGRPVEVDLSESAVTVLVVADSGEE